MSNPRDRIDRPKMIKTEQQLTETLTEQEVAAIFRLVRELGGYRVHKIGAAALFMLRGGNLHTAADSLIEPLSQLIE